MVSVLVNGLPMARTTANLYRADLEAAGIGNGWHGFALDGAALCLPLTPAVVHVQVEDTGQDLSHSPVRIEPPGELNAAARAAIGALLDAPGPDDALRDRAAYLAGQVERLLSRLSDRHSDRKRRVAHRAVKWRWRPEDGPAPATPARRALVVDDAMPGVNRDAGSNAILSHMQSLQRLGFEVSFAPSDMQPGQGSDTLGGLGIAALHAPWFASVEEVLRRQAGEFDLIYLHRIGPASRYLALCRHYAPQARLIYSVADLSSLRLLRQASAEDRPELVPHANQLRAQELAAAAGCHAVLTHSTVEATLLRALLPGAGIHVVPWAMPPRPTPAPFAARQGVAFVGSFGHPPNRDAALWLMDEIMPLVWQADPDIPCLIAGSGMPAAMLAPRHPRDARIRMLGHVEDLQALLDSVRLTTAPLAYGAGLKGKVGDSLAAGVPCVCTGIAAEGFDLSPPLGALVADDAAGLAARIAHLHNSAEDWSEAREAGLACAAQAFSTDAVDAGMRRAAGLPPED